MSYIQKNLLPNEKVLYYAHVHWAVYFPSLFLFIISIIFIVFSLIKASVVSVAGSPPAQPTMDNILWGSILCIAGFGFLFSLFLAVEASIIILTTEFSATNKRVMAKSGFIRIHTLEILLSKVESIDVKQNIFGSLMGFGVITVTGTGGTKQGFRAIANPMEVRTKINQIIEHYGQPHSV